jgi:hypothetical protein
MYVVETYDASDAPDERRPRPLGQFANAAAALAAAREVIEESLSLSLTAGMSAEEAFAEWRQNGEVPTIVARGSAPLQFDPFAFARTRAQELQRRV